MDYIIEHWVAYSWLTYFFADFSEYWQSVLNDSSSELIEQEYDDLFKGTNADIYIPLWASVCVSDDGTLLDAITLKVIQYYHVWGYSPIDMDGNPPDYIGQQLRFLCYLSACAFYAHEHGEQEEMYQHAMNSFIELYLLDTVKVVAQGIKKYAKSPLYQAVADFMLDCFGTGIDLLPIKEQGLSVILKDLVCHDNSLSGRNPAIADSNAKIINTAGRNNCGGKCAIRATVQEGCVLHLDTGCDIGLPQVRACVRGRSYRKTYLSGQRLRYPMKRIGKRGEGRFKRISWEETADIIASEWIRIKEAYGYGSRYVNYGIGVSAVIRPDELAKRLLSIDGGYLGYYNSYSFACTRYVTPYIYGDIYSGNSIEDVLNTKLLILWGNNPAETIFGSQRNYYITKAKEKGVRIIVIDPRQSDTAITFADEWIGIKPSTDSALADGMAYVIWSEGLQDQKFMDAYCLGFDEEHMPDGIEPCQNYKSYLFGIQDGIPKTPEWAEEITGIPAQTIKRTAREYATAKPACLLPGLGNQRIGNGEQTVRSMAMLACLTGNVGIPGGGAAGAGAVQEHPLPALPALPNPFSGSIPCFLWTKAMEDAAHMTKSEDGLEGIERLDSNIKMMFNLAGNALVNQHSDINNSIRILNDTSKCEFIICSDVFMTPSARFADLLLPAPSFLEEDNIAAPWQFGHYILCSNKVTQPLFGCRTEYDWLSDVAKRLGLWDKWSEGRKRHTEWLEHLYSNLRKSIPELPEYSIFKQKGGYTYENSPPYIAYEAQIRDPENNKFATPSGKIEIFSKRLHEMNRPYEIPAIPCYVACPEGPGDPLIKKYPLQLIGWHTKRRCHSIHDNNPWLEEVEPQMIWIHPDDAAIRSISDGNIVEVFNDRGRIHIPAKVTNRVIKGVAAIPQGAWYTPDKSGIDSRGSINVLTSTRPTPLAKGNPQHTNLVEVRSIDK